MMRFASKIVVCGILYLLASWVAGFPTDSRTVSVFWFAGLLCAWAMTAIDVAYKEMARR